MRQKKQKINHLDLSDYPPKKEGRDMRIQEPMWLSKEYGWCNWIERMKINKMIIELKKENRKTKFQNKAL